MVGIGPNRKFLHPPMMGRRRFPFKAGGTTFTLYSDADITAEHGSGDDRSQDALRQGFCVLDAATSRCFARSGAHRVEPAARLEEPCRGDREFGKIGTSRATQPDPSHHPASAETRTFACDRAATWLDRVNRGFEERDRISFGREPKSQERVRRRCYLRIQARSTQSDFRA